MANEGEAPGVVEKIPKNLVVLASITDVVEGAVMIFSVVLEGDMCVLQSMLDDLTAGLSTRRRFCTGSCLLGLSGLTVLGDQGAMPRHWMLLSRTLGVPQGWVFVGGGDELGDSSEPPLTFILTRLVAQ
jgi:hypothetical protein